MQEQNLLEELLIEQINKQNEEENRKWVEAELVATTQWLKLQQYKARLQQEKLEKQAKLKLVSILISLLQMWYIPISIDEKSKQILKRRFILYVI